MPINLYRCPLCGYERESMRKEPKCNHNQDEEGSPYPVTLMEKVLSAPQAKFLEPRSKEKGTSVLKDQEKILKERAKEHARLNDYDDFIIERQNNIQAKVQGWLNKDGKKVKKIETK